MSSAEVMGNLAEHVNTDGAYQSEDNRKFAKDNLASLNAFTCTLKDNSLYH